MVRRYSIQKKKQILHDYKLRRHGENSAEFCRRHGLTRSTLSKWLRGVNEIMMTPDERMNKFSSSERSRALLQLRDSILQAHEDGQVITAPMVTSLGRSMHPQAFHDVNKTRSCYIASYRMLREMKLSRLTSRDSITEPSGNTFTTASSDRWMDLDMAKLLDEVGLSSKDVDDIVGLDTMTDLCDADMEAVLRSQETREDSQRISDLTEESVNSFDSFLFVGTDIDSEHSSFLDEMSSNDAEYDTTALEE